MRKRFRGNNPISTSQELQGGDGHGQLYAGGGAFPTLKGTDGDDEKDEKET